MNGELDFAEALRARVALLKGVPADVFERLKPTITITPGARELCKALKRLGFRMAVLSGGFAPLAEWLAGELALDYAYANHVRNKTTNFPTPSWNNPYLQPLSPSPPLPSYIGTISAPLQSNIPQPPPPQLSTSPTTHTLTGALDPTHPIIDAQQKAHLLRTIAAQDGIPLSQVLAVGDGANDLPMMRAAGLGLAVNAKSRVQLEVCFPLFFSFAGLGG